MHTRHPHYHGTHCCHPVVHHHVVCRHQIEIEVTPENTEVYFADERYVDPINTQVRFDATVYNAPNNSVTWQVTDITGGPGAGSIDPTGLYTAPPKGSIPHGHTDIVMVTANADPTRRAYSKVTLVGQGPEPSPEPKLEIYPQVAYIYYRGTNSAPYNRYIDWSNKIQQFRTLIKNTSSTNVTWDMTGYGAIDNDGLYTAPYEGSNSATATIKAHLTSDSSVRDEAKVILLNYYFIGLN
jgi:hypothetical protein